VGRGFNRTIKDRDIQRLQPLKFEKRGFDCRFWDFPQELGQAEGE
jgi:hypothetical protein